MHINSIRIYTVEFQGDEFQGEDGMADLFPGEEVLKVTRINENPLTMRVETSLAIQGQGTAWVEPVQGTVSISGAPMADLDQPKDAEEDTNTEG